MSSIDERIVQMEFDNSLFDKNVESSIKTLEKLNVALKMDGIDKSLSDISSSVNKMNFSGVESNIESLKDKFSGLTDFITKGVTDFGSRIARAISGEIDRAITGAMHSVEKLAHDLTIAPIKQGFGEYELKMNSVQTIMASTGEDLATVNEELNKLNEYADKTIYSFSDMTSNIGKFTNAGVPLKEAVASIQGIANAAALAGANSSNASHAMYNFAQALSMGYVQLADWKSIEIANMATKDFKQTLIDTAVSVGTLRKEGEKYIATTSDAAGSAQKSFDAIDGFRYSLKDQWLTSQVLTQTLSRYSNEYDDIGAKATEAATKVKTFTQLIDTLKEAVGTGWATTFELIIGDFEQARDLFTGISDSVGGFINKMSDARNGLLEEVLGGTTKAIEQTSEVIKGTSSAMEEYEAIVAEFQKLGVDQSQTIFGNIDTNNRQILKWTEDTVAQYKDALASWGEINTEELIGSVSTVMGMSSEFDGVEIAFSPMLQTSNGAVLLDESTVDKYIWSLIETAGEGWTTEDLLKLDAQGLEVDGQHINGLLADIGETAKTTGEAMHYLGEDGAINQAKKAMEELGEASKGSFEEYRKIADEIWQGKWDNGAERMKKLTEAGYDYDAAMQIVNADQYGWEIDMSKYAEATEKAVKATEELAEVNTEKTGRELLIEAFARIARSASSIFRTLGEAWKQVFPPVAASTLKDGIKAFNEFTKSLVPTPAVLNNIRNVLKGLLAPISIVFDAVLGLARAAFTPLVNILATIGKWFLQILSPIGQFVANIAKAIHESDIFYKIINGVIKLFTPLFSAIKGIGDSVFKAIRLRLFEAGRVLTDLGSKVVEFWNVFKETKGVKYFTGVIGRVSEGLTKVKDSVVGGIKRFFDSFSAIKIKLPNFDVKGLAEKAGDAVGKLGAKIELARIKVKSFFEDVKVNEDNPLHGMYTYFSNLTAQGLIDSFSSKLSKAKESITNFLKESGIAAKAQSVFSNAIARVKETAPVVFKGVGKALTNAGSAIISAKDKVVEFWKSFKLTDAYKNIKTGVADTFKKILDTFDKAGSKVSDFFKNLFDEAGNFKMPEISVSGIIESIGEKIEWVKTKFLEFKEFLSGLFKGNEKTGLADTASAGLDGLSTVIERIKSGVSDTWGVISPILYGVGTFKLTTGIGGFFKKLGGVCETFSGIGEKVKGVLGGVTEGIERVSKASAHEKNAKAIMYIAIAFGILAASFFALGQLNPEQLKMAAIGIGIVTVALIALMGAFRLFFGNGGSGTVLSPLESFQNTMAQFGTKLSKALSKFGTAAIILSFVIAIKVLISAIKQIGEMDEEVVAKGILVVSVLMIFLTACTKILTSGKNFSAGKGFGTALTLIAFVLAIKMLVGAVQKLGKMNTKQLIKGTLAVTLLGGILAGLIFVSKNLKKVKPGPILALAVVIAAITGALYLLSSIDPKGLLAASVSIGLIVAALGWLTFALSKMKTSNMAGAIGAMVGAGLLLAEISAILYLFTSNPDLDADKMLTVSESISMLATVAGGLTFLSQVLGKAGIAGLGYTALGTIDIGVFTALLTGIMSLIGWGTDQLIDDELAGQIMHGLDLVEQIFGKFGEIIGSLVGGIIGGIVSKTLTSVTDDLPSIGTNLSQFYTNLGDLGKGDVSFDGITSLLTAVRDIAQAGKDNIIADALTFIFTGGEESSSLVKLGEELNAFAPYMKTYAEDIKGMDQDAVTGTSGAIQTIMEFANAVPPSGGLYDAIMGSTDLSKFGEEVTKFAVYMKRYSKIITANGGIDSGAIEQSTAAGTLLAELNKAIPADGGWLQKFVGHKSLATFGDQLPQFAEGLIGFSQAITKDGVTIDKTATENAAACGEILAGLANDKIPRSGGFLQKLMGELDLGLFGQQAGTFGEGMAAFAQAISKDGVKIDKTATENAAVCGEILAALATDKIPASGGLLQWLAGEKNLETFGNQLPGFATGLAGFSENIVKFKAENVTGVTEAITGLMGMLGILQEYGYSSTNVLSTDEMYSAIAAISSAVQEFSDQITAVGEDTKKGSALDNIKKAGEQLAKDLKGALIEGLQAGAESADATNTTSVGSADTSYLKTIIDSMIGDDASVESALSESATDIAGKLVTAISEATKKPETLKLGDSSSPLQKILSSMFGKDADIEADVKPFGEKLGQKLIRAIGEGANSSSSESVKTGIKETSALTKLIESIFGTGDALPPEVEEKGKGVAKGIVAAIQTGISTPEEPIDISIFLQSIVDSLNSADTKAESAGSHLASAVASGIRNNRYSSESAGRSLGSAAATGARGQRDNMKSVGEYLSQGLAVGISNGSSQVINAAIKVATDAITAAKSTLRSQSPSRVFIEIGEYVSEGFAIGILDNSDMVTKAATEMSNLTIASAGNSLDSGIEEMAREASKSIAAAYIYINQIAQESLNSNPVITPVLDMSMLQNGMNSMNNLWGMSSYSPFGYANSMFPGSYQYANTMRANSDYVTQTELRGIRTDIKQLGEAITNMNMVLDSGMLVGQLTPGIDRNLGSISSMKERWA